MGSCLARRTPRGVQKGGKAKAERLGDPRFALDCDLGSEGSPSGERAEGRRTQGSLIER
jgi:hypothetical protein